MTYFYQCSLYIGFAEAMGGYDSTHAVTHHPAESVTDSCSGKQSPESMLRNMVEINEQCFRSAGQECGCQESAEEQSRQVHLGTILCDLNKERCFLSMAEREGFEPSVRYSRTHAFQACTFSRSVTSPN